MAFTLRQLRHFVAAAESGQVSRAAQLCHVSQPSITASLRNLEEALGASLFRRHARGLQLTEHGEHFLRHALRVLDAADDAAEAMAGSLDTVDGTINIGMTETITAYLLPDLLRALRRRHPTIRLKVTEERRDAIETGIRAGDLELAIVLVSNLDSFDGLEHRTLSHSPRRLWAPVGHPLLKYADVRLEDVAAYPYILLTMDEHVRTVEKFWTSRELSPNVTFASSSLEAVRSLVAQGAGISILSDMVYRRWSLDGDRIVKRELADPVPTMDVGLIWQKGRSLSAAAQALIALLDSFTDLPKLADQRDV